jgi:hypothetical protein
MSAFRTGLLLLLATLCTCILGCGNNGPPPTLVVHFHDNVYDLIDHDGKVIATAKDLDEFEKLSATPAVKSQIRGNRIVARFAGVSTPNGMTPPEEVLLLMDRTIHLAVYKMDFEYTNEPNL